MEQKTEKKSKKHYIPYIIYGLMFGAFILAGYEMFGDDFNVREKLMPDLLQELYRISRSYVGWSSRIFINPPIWLIMHFPIWVWGSITTLLAVYIFWGIDRLLFQNKDMKATYVMLLLLAMLPMEAFCDVGWVVTSMTYIWPFAAAIASCFSIRRFIPASNEPSDCLQAFGDCREGQIPRSLGRFKFDAPLLAAGSLTDGKKIKWQQSLCLCLCTIYAANKEELSVMLFLIFGTFFIISAKKKKINKTIFLQTVISLLSLLFHMLSGGNAERYESFGKYNDTFYDKLEIGLTQTALRLFLKYDYMCLAFCWVLMLIIFIKYKNVLVRAISVIPVTAWISGAFGALVLSDGSIDAAAYDKPLFCYGLSVSRGKYTHPMAWIMLLCSIIVMLALVYTAMKCAPDKKTALLSFLLLAAAYGGRATTGFANSGWGLYARTYIFMYYVFVILMAAYIQAVMKDTPGKKANIIMRCLIIFALMGFLRNIVTTGII